MRIHSHFDCLYVIYFLWCSILAFGPFIIVTTGSGYATEAVRAFLPAVTRLVGIDQIENICLKENAASIHVMEKRSFRQVFNGPGE